MNFKFKLKSGEAVRVFINDYIKDESKNIHGVVSWSIETKNREYKEHNTYLLEDESGKLYFNYQDEVLYMEDFLAKTPEEFVEALNNDEIHSSDELVWTLLKYGINSLKVDIKKEQVGVNPSKKSKLRLQFRNKYKKDNIIYCRVEHKFEEPSIFKLRNNYKISLTPVNDKDRDKYTSRTYYLSDLTWLLTKFKDEYIVKVGA